MLLPGCALIDSVSHEDLFGPDFRSYREKIDRKELRSQFDRVRAEQKKSREQR